MKIKVCGMRDPDNIRVENGKGGLGGGSER